MKKSRYTEEQIAFALSNLDAAPADRLRDECAVRQRRHANGSSKEG